MRGEIERREIIWFTGSCSLWYKKMALREMAYFGALGNMGERKKAKKCRANVNSVGMLVKE